MPDSIDNLSKPALILNVRMRGDPLTFEEQDGNEVTKFELRVVGEGKAELTFSDALFRIKAIRFARK